MRHERRDRGRRDRGGVRHLARRLLVRSSSGSGSGTAASGGGGASYFKGKTITLISPDSPGGSYDSYARLFAPYLGQELGATINVEDVSGAGTLQGSNQMAAAAPNGLTIGMVNVGGDIAQPAWRSSRARPSTWRS